MLSFSIFILQHFFWFIVRGCVMICFLFKKPHIVSFRIAYRFFHRIREYAWLTNHAIDSKYFLILVKFLRYSFFSSSSTSIGRGSGVRLVLGVGMVEILIASLGSGLDIWMRIWKDAQEAMNIFSSCCLEIFP